MARPRLLRFSLIGLASLLVILLIAGVVLGVVLVRRPFPQYGGEVTIPGLRASVIVQRDDRGVPQVYADNPEDLFRAQGYVQAQDQFFAMDWRRHVTSGRLAELVGNRAEAIASDKLVRTLGWRQVAQQEEKQLDPVTRSYLTAFAAGVNDYLAGRSTSRISLNYAVLSVRVPLAKIEPWTVTDSLAWFQGVAWQLRGDYDDELVRARVLGSVKDVSRVDELYPAYPYASRPPIVSADQTARLTAALGTSVAASETVTGSGTTSGRSTRPRARSGSTTLDRRMQAASAVLQRALLGADAQGMVEQARQAVAAVPSVLGSGRAVGANAWVVSGSLTAGGKPLLADDPQLSGTLPGIWYQIGLHCRKVSTSCPFDVSGYTFAGVPGVVIGHNARISWGLSSLGPDITDYYLERVDGNSYQRDGKTVAMTSRTETIAVAGGSPVTITVRSTEHGPIVSDLTDMPGAPAAGTGSTGVTATPGTAPTVTAAAQGSGSSGTAGTAVRDHQYAVSIAWSALQPGHDAQAVFALDLATDFAAFRAAAQQYDTPAQSFVYADVDGHIGYQVAGRIPVRRSSGTVSASAGTSATGSGTGTVSGTTGGTGSSGTGTSGTGSSGTATSTGTAGGSTATGSTAAGSTATGSASGTATRGTTSGAASGQTGTPAPASTDVAGATGTAGSGQGDTGQATAAPASPQPDRIPSDGSWPMPGWDSAFDWTGFVPAAQLPWEEDPRGGLIVAANQPVTSPDYPVQLAADWDYGYRAQRIRSLVAGTVKQHKLTVADLQTIQGDTANPIAAQLVPLLLQVKTDAFTQQAVDLLKGWDYTQPSDSAAAAYFNAVWASLLDLTFNDELPEGARPDGGQRWFEVVRTLLKDPRNPWWDDHRTPDVVETEAEDLRQAMVQARLHLTSILGKDPSRWAWGQLHHLRLTEQPLGDLTSTTVLHPLLNRGPIELGGGSSAVDAMGWDAASGGFVVTDAPSLRMVVDLGNFDGSRWVNATGQSGHPGQGHYADQLDAWARNETFSWPFTTLAVTKAATDTLTLKPGSAG